MLSSRFGVCSEAFRLGRVCYLLSYSSIHPTFLNCVLTVEQRAEFEAAPESSAWAAERERQPAREHRQCTSCDTRQPLGNVYQAPCGHHYCQDCLHTLFELSITDETLFPPRCCRQQMPLATVKLYLNADLMQSFEEKSIEWRSTDRTYCSQPTCSSFIPAENISNERADCPTCSTRTCTICKNQAHDGDCPQDLATQQVLETARGQGWQRCFNCRRLVELDVGCNHMTYVIHHWR